MKQSQLSQLERLVLHIVGTATIHPLHFMFVITIAHAYGMIAMEEILHQLSLIEVEAEVVGAFVINKVV